MVPNFHLLMIILFCSVYVNESWMSRESGILKNLEAERQPMTKIIEQLKIMKKQINLTSGKDIKDIQHTRSALEAAEKAEMFMEIAVQKMTKIFDNDIYKYSKEDGDYSYVLVRLQGSNGIFEILEKAKVNMQLCHGFFEKVADNLKDTYSFISLPIPSYIKYVLDIGVIELTDTRIKMLSFSSIIGGVIFFLLFLIQDKLLKASNHDDVGVIINTQTVVQTHGRVAYIPPYVFYPTAILLTVGLVAYLFLYLNYNKQNNTLDCLHQQFESQIKRGNYNIKSEQEIKNLIKTWEMAANVKNIAARVSTSVREDLIHEEKAAEKVIQFGIVEQEVVSLLDQKNFWLVGSNDDYSKLFQLYYKFTEKYKLFIPEYVATLTIYHKDMEKIVKYLPILGEVLKSGDMQPAMKTISNIIKMVGQFQEKRNVLDIRFQEMVDILDMINQEVEDLKKKRTQNGGFWSVVGVVGVGGVGLAACLATGPACIPALSSTTLAWQLAGAGTGAAMIGLGKLGFDENNQHIKVLNEFEDKLQDVQKYLEHERKNIVKLQIAVDDFGGELRNLEEMNTDILTNKLEVSNKDKAAIDLFIEEAVEAGEKAVNELEKSVRSIFATHTLNVAIEHIP